MPRARSFQRKNHMQQLGKQPRQNHRVIIVPVPETSPLINTPWRLKTTVWRIRFKAAATEKALHTAAILKHQYIHNKTPISVLSQRNIGVSTPSKIQIDTVQSTPYTTMAIASSYLDDSEGSQATESRGIFGTRLPYVMDIDGEDAGFGDVDDDPQTIQLPLHLETEEAIETARGQWPDVNSVGLQFSILSKRVRDIEAFMASSKVPSGNDFTWHLQVLQFMNWQLKGLKNPYLQSLPSRRECAINVAIGFGKDAKVRERIIGNEKQCIKDRKIESSKQGRAAKLIGMLEDQGTIIAIQECIGSASGGVKADMICKAVSQYWKSQMTSADMGEEIQLLSSSLQELYETEDSSILSSQKLTIHANTAPRWLHTLGYCWKKFKNSVYKDGYEREDVVEGSSGNVEEVEIPYLEPGDKLCIPVTHDEATCNANDGPHYQWIKGDENILGKKSRGQGLHISELTTPHGRLSVPEYELSDQELIQHGLHKRNVIEII
ncbi:hypothetical protein DFP73DRAFT_591438 [Morchella snyderi]|nr:hypothetical protein DFP73DRAFT_591438 [Morchella snyderi]